MIEIQKWSRFSVILVGNHFKEQSLNIFEVREKWSIGSFKNVSSRYCNIFTHNFANYTDLSYFHKMLTSNMFTIVSRSAMDFGGGNLSVGWTISTLILSLCYTISFDSSICIYLTRAQVPNIKLNNFILNKLNFS